MKFDLNKIIELFNNLSDQARYCVLAAVVFVIIILDAVFLVLPQMGSIADVNAKISKLSDDTQQVADSRAQIYPQRKNLQEIKEQLNALSARVRSIQEVPAILDIISSTANEYGVKIDQLVPQKGQQETLATAADGKYYALPVVIKAHSGYHMFGRFLNKLENGELYFTMKDFIIQNDDKDTNTHLFSLTIKIILVDRGMVPAKNL